LFFVVGLGLASNGYSQNCEEIEQELATLKAKLAGLEESNRKMKESADDVKNATDAELSAKRQQLEADMKKLSAEKAQLQKEIVSQENKLADAKKGLADQANSAKNDAANNLKDKLNSFKHLDVGFGVLPNSDKKVNNYAKLGVNYSPKWATSVTYNSRNTGLEQSTTSSQTVAGSEIEGNTDTSITIQRTSLEFKLVEWKPTEWTMFGSEIKPSLNIGWNQINEVREKRDITKQTFKDSTSGKDREILINDHVLLDYDAFLPRIGFDIEADLGERISIIVGGGALVGNQEKYTYNQRGTANFPAASKSATDENDEIKAQVIENKDNNTNHSTSNGFTARTDLLYNGIRQGYGIHSQILAKKGKRKEFSFNITPVDPAFDGDGNITNEGEIERTLSEVEITEERYQIQLGLSWSMFFMRDWAGLVPIFRINFENDVVTTQADGGDKETEETKLYDFGLIFNY
jgi:cell division protein FtsB